MSGIAEILVNMGHVVTGSDLVRSATTERLESLGVTVFAGHEADHVGEAELVVVSTAVPPDNPERVAAEARGIPVMARGQMLAELTKTRRTVAVVGAHGKTTTSSMVAVALDAAGLDPTAIIGGRLSVFGSNARLGAGPFMVVEADESDRSFLWLDPEIAVLTNVDDEHLESYRDMADLESSFQTFARRAAARGSAIVCVDDPCLRRMASRIPGHVVTYGIDDASADVRATAITLEPAGSRLTVAVPGVGGADHEAEIVVPVPGRHNAENALAAVAVGHQLGLSPETVGEALASFHGAERRYQEHAASGEVVVIDDYAHHPTEIEAVLRTVRLRQPRRLRVVFQPHRFTRTARLMDRFGPALALADEVFVTEIYAASETPIPGVTAHALRDVVAASGPVSVRVVALDDVVETIVRDARSGDVVVTLGAGSIGAVPSRLVAALQARDGGQ